MAPLAFASAGSSVKLWWQAARPFTFSASVMPVLLGTAAAVTCGQAAFKPLLSFAAIVGMLLLHAGSNLINDACDFRGGLDREARPFSGGVVRGAISVSQALKAAAVLFVLGAAIGIYLALTVSITILAIGIAGVMIGIVYSAGPFALKRRALGDLAVFLNFGLLGSLGAWIVQTGRPAWIPVIWAMPIALLVVAILHANNWRDVKQDAACDYHTIAACLGHKGSRIYYAALLLLPYVLIISFVMIGPCLPTTEAMPIAALAVLLSLPLAGKLCKSCLHRCSAEGGAGLIDLDGRTSQLNLIFGALYVAALIIGGIF